MLTENALKIVARNIEDYYRKKAPNGAWCISTVLGAAEQFAAMRGEISAMKAENERLEQLVESLSSGVKYSFKTALMDELKSYRAEVPKLKAENERLMAYRVEIIVKPNEDNEYWCPKCGEQIVGYYASYCEYCGQCVELESNHDQN